MLFKQLCGLVFSGLLSISPVSNYQDITYPFTRNNQVYYRTTYTVSDLGYAENVDLATISQGLSAQYQNAKHNFIVNYTIHVYCNAACSYPNISAGAHNVSDNEIEIYYMSRQSGVTLSQLNSYLDGTVTHGSFSSSYTYTNANSVGSVDISITVGTYSTVLTIRFPAENNYNLLRSIAYNLEDFKSDYEIVNYKNIIYRLVLNKDVPSDVKQTVLNYVNNGDYSSAVTYINNYYNSSEVSNTEYNETIINTYKGKEKDLNTVVSNENNFTIGIENNFKNQILDLNPDNSVITNTNFQQAAVWVTDKFNRFTNNNAFGSLLGFSLLIGFALALIGRVLR